MHGASSETKQGRVRNRPITTILHKQGTCSPTSSVTDQVGVEEWESEGGRHLSPVGTQESRRTLKDTAKELRPWSKGRLRTYKGEVNP